MAPAGAGGSSRQARQLTASGGGYLQGGWALALALKTEVFYDAAGSLTFLSLALGSLGYGASFYARQVVLTVMACVWTLRLGGFLLMRVLVTGRDSRFDEAKHQPRECVLVLERSGRPAF